MHNTRNGAARKLLGALLCTLAFTACQPAPEAEPGEEAPATGAGEQPVVYGNDDRKDVFEHTNATLKARAEQATVALMSPSDFNASNPNNVTFNGPNLGSSENLCTSQRFRSDPTAAWCSGTLIDDDLVLTAGHCVESAAECGDTRIVFNYYRTAANTLKTVTTADIFSCQSIVVRKKSTTGGRDLDFAILKLDRAATPRFTPAPVRAGNTALATGANVAVIGSGSGIPFKIDSGGSVRTPRASTLDYFVATTDTFAGNSGSGVYETAEHTLAGILVRGDEDYIGSGSCNVVNTCTETGCNGEEITYVSNAITALCQATTNARLCGSGPPPTGGSNFTFSASATASATTNTTNKTVALTAGQKITLGTCGVTGAAVTGDSYLRLFGPSGTEVASNDDGCGGRGSNLSFTATQAGNYEVRAGCYSSGACSGTVAWTLEGGGTGPAPSSGSFAYTASATNSAQTGTTNQGITVAAGQSISFGTCTVTGAAGTGDTFLRLYNSAGQQVTSNDDSCGSLSYANYTVPAGAGGTYQVRAGCFGNSSCGGTVAWTVQ
ncbi:trypsin-like peptidase domain-containing protein [Myxococcus sp. CA051A]|uniref:serine protease n=1 Tax=unclassified Myxococcus TaxID=2648731 RepID=UPI00157B55B7|nr:MULTISPECIES: serine protease [unclassified Myxococcus]NTX11846.1 trypsin-like peptidase domain-containing protein [Myxococcus sp. CA056]NTX34052.1 trypsin-like peptidase domain-containing protein [Myxococcus sp. CA033]NTX55446.1 trypsin-like peptidase domain-containing protein [Myxococcus sp. CA039A]NTX65761.1 trypsin-like peptidase domain-containing protein [Myxococcus sp. CA051A]